MNSKGWNEGIEVSSINAKNKLEQSNSTFILRRREVKELNRKVLCLALAVAMLALPMISIAQAKPGGIPTETYHDLKVGGMIVPDYNPESEVRGNIQYAEYTAHCDMVTIRWDFIGGIPQQMLMGTATYVIEYKINLNTMKGVAHVKTEVTVGESTFEGEIIWVGDLVFNTYFPAAVMPNAFGDVKLHTVWKGTGAYDGWKIIQNINVNPPWTNMMTYEIAGDNHLIKPID
jgi:hypothetical protein